MTKREGIDRGRTQPASVGKAGRVMSAGFKAGSDDGPNTKRSKAARTGKASPKVNSYPRQFQSAAQQIHAALTRGAKK